MSGLVEIFDTTLRDGSQQEDISFSVETKLAIAKRLDWFGVRYIELGWPGSNPKDTEAFEQAKHLSLQNARLVAFGMTCGKGRKPKDDEQLARLIATGTEIITIVGKSSKDQVETVLCADLEENLRMIRETCEFLVEGHGITVFFDAEHFFDGYKKDPGYTLDCIRQAVFGGASKVILCDTNGGSMPWDVITAVSGVKAHVDIPLGIHVHNDGGLGVANSLAAVRAGVEQVQGTINGLGERVGNADLLTIIANLQLKMGISCVSPDQLAHLTELSRYIDEVSNLIPDAKRPYVGRLAFAHKAGLHVSAVARDTDSYNHISPALVGNKAAVLVSELSGQSNIKLKAAEFDLNLFPDQVKRVLAQVEDLEKNGLQFAGADGSLELLMLRVLDGYRKPFEVFKRSVVSEQSAGKSPVDSATLRIWINNGKEGGELYVADGNGPIDAMDGAIRKALLPKFPCVENLKLVDYKVRVLAGKKGTAKAVRTLVDFEWGERQFTTVGCSTDSVGAGLQALTDGFEYVILKHK